MATITETAVKFSNLAGGRIPSEGHIACLLAQGKRVDIEKWHGDDDDGTLYRTNYTPLGWCLIDTYRASGDLYSSWDIVPQNEDSTFSRVPDARYGVDQPEYPERTPEEETPLFLAEYHSTWSDNGWTKNEFAILEVFQDGFRAIVSRED